MGIAMIDGKIYLRKLDDKHMGQTAFGLVGVIAVPTHFDGERIYPAVVSERNGFYIDIRSRRPKEVAGPWVGGEGISSLVTSLDWRAGAFPGACELFLRDTELPGAPYGHKWVIVAGASKTHEGDTRMISVRAGQVSVMEGEQWSGNTLDAPLHAPIWGPQDNACALAVCLALDTYEEEFRRSRGQNRAPIFLKYVERMETAFPFKTWYTVEEKQKRDEMSSSILRDLLQEADIGGGVVHDAESPSESHKLYRDTCSGK